MVSQCSVPGCSNESGCKENLRMHGFPFHNDDILQQWITVIKRINWKPTKNSKICGDHFVQNDYITLGSCRLKPTAIPSRCLPIVCCHVKFQEKDTQTSPQPKRSSSFIVDEVAWKRKIKSLQRTVQRRNKQILKLNSLLDQLKKYDQPSSNLIQNTDFIIIQH